MPVAIVDILKLILEMAIREEGLDSRYVVVDAPHYRTDFLRTSIAVTLKDRESQVLRVQINEENQVRPCYAEGG